MRRKLGIAVAVVVAAIVSMTVVVLHQPQAARAVAPVITPNGTLTLTTPHPVAGDPLTFHYSTDAANVPTGSGGDNGDGTGSGTDDNWIGIYDNPSYGPNTDGTYSGHGSTVYKYVSGDSGDVTFSAADVAGLTTGTKVAFYLYDNQYQWLATPLAFSLLPSPAPTVDGTFTLTNTGPITLADTVTFDYTVPSADIPTGTDGTDGNGSGSGTDDNWVGIYKDPTASPYDDVTLTSHGASTSYQYVHGTSGTVSFPASALATPGGKVAYLMYDNQYHWLAYPVAFFVAASSSGPSSNGTLTLTSTDLSIGADLTFSYATTTPDPLNWVALYNDPADGPTDQTYHAASTVWSYVTGAAGQVTLNTTGMTTGEHTAYFLYQDGYKWLAKPITFSLVEPPPPPPVVTPHFVTDDFLAGYVPPRGKVSQALAGLWIDPDSTNSTYRKVGGDSWLSVSQAGVVTGRAPNRIAAHPALIEVAATDDKGNTAQVTVEFASYGTANPPQLKTASWNLWDAGSHVSNPVEKELSVILTNQLDVVGVQESDGTAAKTLGTDLGWYYYQSSGDLGLVSRYPISNVTAPTASLPAAGVTLTVGSEQVRVWTAHLDETGYGPAAICLAGTTPAKALTAERASTRYRQAVALTAALKPDLARSGTRPLVLLGDLASPSQLDWTKASSALHCGAGAVDWPVTEALAKAGLSDSYRVANPSPVTDPGNTWSPVLATDPATGKPEPQDRIDYVDFAGRALRVSESHALVVGFPQQETGTASATDDSQWTSDHAAAVTTFVFRKTVQ